MTQATRATTCANALAGLSLASLIVGVAYSASPAVGAGTAPAGHPLLWIAEVLKLLSAGALAGLVTSPAARPPARLVGLASATTLALAGLIGFAALALERADLATAVPILALGALAGTGAWSALAVATIDRAHRWTRAVGGAYALAALLSWTAAPVALVAAVLGIVWWRALASVIAVSPDASSKRGR
jgi:hypothetical protein